MTEPAEPELLELAAPYALNAVSDGERADIERRVASARAEVSAAFHDEVRAIREVMAVLSNVTAAPAPPALRARVLAAVDAPVGRRTRWRTAALAAAAAAIIAAGGFGVGVALRPPAPAPSVAEQVLSAPDVRSVSTSVPAGGTATVVYSRERNTAVLVMSSVPPPAADTVYQMWLLEDGKPRSAGTIGAAIGPSATDVVRDLGGASTLAFTVEPGSGSPQPTGEIFAQLPLD
ncbi:anti-sigma factor [Mycobacterium sp. GA-1841]|uniref:anti-sigma factor n=1 Tax=Mycobacterium sp. GA-1841 TaxID=1834154 RepID=UPI00096F06AB|nr:anti-sigma factor [Mycobacterium sp. GA-1841]OMC32357.1 anti-sigma factor [Mycobacterium sp. GA-1841]